MGAITHSIELNRGAITFEQLDTLRTRITLSVEYEPEGFIEQAGDVLGIPLGQVAEDLKRFRELENGSEALVTTGRIHTVETPPSTALSPSDVVQEASNIVVNEAYSDKDFQDMCRKFLGRHTKRIGSGSRPEG